MKKIKVGLVFGGKSSEHQVSLVSAWNIFHGFDSKKFDVFPVGISKEGEWYYKKNETLWCNTDNIKKISLNLKTPQITVANVKNKTFLINLKNGEKITDIDVFFPITHGTYGEDGCLQGFFETIGCAYAGPSVLGSAVGMDKDVAKRLLKEAGFEQSKFYVLRREEKINTKLPGIIKNLKFPIFVKPARQGSSVGISKAENKKQLLDSIDEALKYDSKIILEQAIVGREIECSVLGNNDIIASNPGEICLQKGFYSYDAKYVDEDAAKPVVNATLSSALKKKIQQMAIEVYKTLECEGFSRVDFFLTKENKIFVNEINTLPGFTNVSMFPKMFENSGIKYSELLERLVFLAIERKNNKIG